MKAIVFLAALWMPASSLGAEDMPYPQSIPVSKGGMKPVYEQIKVKARDDVMLVVHEWAPPKKTEGKPVVVFLHGLGMHGEPYGAIAYGWTSQGITLVVPDLRGHGRSEGDPGDLAEAHVLRSDIDRVLDWINTRHPQSPVILLGESMGGIIAADYARQNQKRLAGLILLVPAFRVNSSRFKVMPDFMGLLQTGKIAIDSTEHLKDSTREPGFMKAKQADPLATHSVKPTYLLRIANMGISWPDAAGELKVPLVICVGAEDKIINNKVAQQVFDKAGTPKEQKTFKEWEKAYHTLCWDPVTPELIDYLANWTLDRRK